MKQKATVISTEGKYASVRVDRASMCGGCHKEGCSDGCTIYKIFGAKTEFSAEAVNKVGAKIGDTVVVEASDKSVNLSAFIVFILPIVTALAVYFASFFIGDVNIRILLAVISFFLYFIILVITERARRSRTPVLRITEIVGEGN